MKMASPKRSSLLSVPSIITQSNSDITTFIREFKQRIRNQLQLDNEGYPFLLFDEIKNSPVQRHDDVWLNDNQHRFFRNTPNERLVKKSYLSELGYIYSMTYSPDGNYIITGHSTGLIQMRHGQTGTVMATLRNIQFPPKPVYALEYSRNEKNVCYAACTDGAVYRLDIPDLRHIDATAQDTPKYCIRADPALECLNTQYYGTPGASGNSSPFIIRNAAFKF